MTAAASRYGRPPKNMIAQANGRAAKEPNVPEATGALPDPNHVPKTKAVLFFADMILNFFPLLKKMFRNKVII